MFSMCGYNFCSDGNCLDAAPAIAEDIITTTLTNGIFDHFNVSSDVNKPYSPTPPTVWDYLTLMDANFNGNIDAGNVNYSLETLSGFKVKRRKKTDFDWIPLTYFPVTTLEQLSFIFNDNLPQSLEEYEYGFVPIINGVEGDYITNTIKTKFNGVFICDQDTIYRFYSGVGYDSVEQVQKIGVLEPFGQQYPVVISNALTNYQKGRVKGTVLQNSFTDTRTIDRLGIVKERKELLAFLTSKKAKILKDWNGNSWLMKVVGNPSTSYPDNYGMGVATVGFDYVEMGDSNSAKDLFKNGVIKEG